MQLLRPLKMIFNLIFNKSFFNVQYFNKALEVRNCKRNDSLRHSRILPVGREVSYELYFEQVIVGWVDTIYQRFQQLLRLYLKLQEQIPLDGDVTFHMMVVTRWRSLVDRCFLGNHSLLAAKTIGDYSLKNYLLLFGKITCYSEQNSLLTRCKHFCYSLGKTTCYKNHSLIVVKIKRCPLHFKEIICYCCRITLLLKSLVSASLKFHLLVFQKSLANRYIWNLILLKYSLCWVWTK